jgi:hypothetical protein
MAFLLSNSLSNGSFVRIRNNQAKHLSFGKTLSCLNRKESKAKKNTDIQQWT